MDEAALSSLFPELLRRSHNPLSDAEFAELPYFSRYHGYIPEKQCRGKAEKSRPLFQLMRVSRGTVIYAFEDYADQGYLLLQGCVELLTRKNSREKVEAMAGHIAQTLPEKMSFLYDNYRIPREKVESLTSIFYEDKIQFKFMPFRTMISHDEFGFGEMVRNCARLQTAIATEETVLLVIGKEDFDAALRDFHVKKENLLINKILKSTARGDLAEEMAPKMAQIMNTSALLQLDTEDTVYREGDYSQSLYYILQGELEVRKTEILEVPKKFMKSENTGPLKKEVVIRVAKMGSNSLVGEDEIFSSRKSRAFTLACCLNGTLLVKIDHNLFIKAVADFLQFEKSLIANAVEKRAMAEEACHKQFQKIRTAFLNQYEEHDNKKKEKMLSNILSDFEGKNQLFEVYAPEGVFFRDTFQKLEGFEESQRDPHQKQSIKRFRAKNQAIAARHPGTPILDKSRSAEKIDPTEKILFSPKKTMNAIEFYGEAILEKSMSREGNLSHTASPSSRHKVEGERPRHSQPLIKAYKSIGRFQSIQKDEAIFKRVLIKNGLYPKEKDIDRANAAKPLIHHNFDEVVKQCIARKNHALKRTSKEKQDEIVLDSFQRTVQNLKSHSVSTSQLMKFSRFTTPCRGTEEMKKRMQSIHHLHSGRVSDLSKNKKSTLLGSQLEECMGVNSKPRSSATPTHAHEALMSARKLPQKIVLLNHMMKPITYFNSTEF